MKVYDIKAGPPTLTIVLLYLQIMVSLGIPLLTEQFIVIEYPAVACIIPSSVSFWTAMFIGIPTRKDHLKNLTCSASNSNFSLAIAKTIQLNVNCKCMF
jgi:hypothetical protein